MISTHLLENFHSQKITLEEYQTCVQSGQTHSMSTHKKYYVKKRKMEDGHVILNTFAKIFPQREELANVEDYYSRINHHHHIESPTPANHETSVWSPPPLPYHHHPPPPPPPQAWASHLHPPPHHLSLFPEMSPIDSPTPANHETSVWSPPPLPYHHPPPQAWASHLDPHHHHHLSLFPEVNPIESTISASHQHVSSSFAMQQETPTSSLYQIVTSHREFGLARSDLHVSRRKYDWIPEEISFLQEYIQTIEPTLGSQAVSKSRYALCLNYLKNSAEDKTIQYFHPHHVASSDRLKNGFLRALEDKH